MPAVRGKGCGGKRAGSGRKKGTPNKSTAEMRALAQQHAETAIAELARLVKKARNEQTRIAAAKELLDRGYGKSTQPLEHDGNTRPVFNIVTGVPRRGGDDVTTIVTGVSEPEKKPAWRAKDGSTDTLTNGYSSGS